MKPYEVVGEAAHQDDPSRELVKVVSSMCSVGRFSCVYAGVSKNGVANGECTHRMNLPPHRYGSDRHHCNPDVGGFLYLDKKDFLDARITGEL